MKPKIEVTQRQFDIISNLYHSFVRFAIVGIIILSGVLQNKLVEIIFCMSLFLITKLFLYYKLHDISDAMCLVYSSVIFIGLSMLTLQIKSSLLFAPLLGIFTALLASKIAETNLEKYLKQQKLKVEYEKLKEEKEKREAYNLNSCTEEELRFRCRERNIKTFHADFAVDAFVKQMTIKQLMSAHGYEESAVKTLKRRLKAKLK